MHADQRRPSVSPGPIDKLDVDIQANVDLTPVKIDELSQVVGGAKVQSRYGAFWHRLGRDNLPFIRLK